MLCSGALHLHTVGVTLGGDGLLGGAVPDEQVAGGNLAGDVPDAGFLAGGLGGCNQDRVPVVFLQIGGILADHVQLGVVIQHRPADDHIADANLAGHVPGDAREDDPVGAVFGNQNLGGGGGIGLAHAGTADHHLPPCQAAAVVADPAVFLHLHIGQAGTELVHFVGHGAHDADDHGLHPLTH